MSLRPKTGYNLVYTLCLFLVGLAVLFPLFWMLRSSFLSNIEINTYPPKFLPETWHVENYPAALTTFPFLTYLINTLIITVPSVAGVLLTSTLAAYSFARLSFPLKKFWFALVISSMLMPASVTVIPIFIAWSTAGLSNSYWPLIVPAYLGGGAFNIFLVRQFIMTIPRDLDEAAFIDGAGHGRILFQILLPLIKPVLISVGLFAFTLYWNDLLGPLIYLSRNEMNTISQGLANFITPFGTDWKAVMALSCLSIAPSVALYLFGQKYFIEGIVLSGLKS